HPTLFRSVEQPDLIVVDGRQAFAGTEDGVVRRHGAQGQQADAQTGGHGVLDAVQAGAGIGDAPVPAHGLDGADDVLAVQAPGRKGHQRYRIGPQAWMARAVDPGQGFRPAGNGRTAVAALLDQDEVQFTPVVAGRQPGTQAAGDLQLDPGVVAAEVRQDLRRAAGDEILGYAQANGGGNRRARHDVQDLVVERQQVARMAEQGLAGVGRQDLAAAPVQQAVADQVFEPADLLADGG